MSGIDDLIQELCPDGVEHTGVLDIADYVRGITYSKNDEDSAGEIQVLRANNITLASNTLNFEDVKRVSSHVRVRDAQRLRAGDTLICAGSGSRDHIGKVAYIREDIGQTFGGFMAVLRTTDARVESRFLFHLLTGERFKTHLDRSLSTSTINNLNASVMRGFRVPVPPLEVQREIVRVLDKFTQLEAELEAELEARRSQYEHYRAKLLNAATQDATHVPLGNLGRIVTGRTPKSSDASAWGDEVDFVTPSDIRNGLKIVTTPGRRLSGVGAASMARVMIPSRSVLVTCIGADMGKTVINANDCVTNQQINSIVPTEDIVIEFFFHLLTSMRDRLREQGERAGGTMPLINKTDFSKIEVPVPSIEVQAQVAVKLDKLDALVNDISIGLPAELAARRKQYEYYRDRLLTFKELAS